MYSWQTSIGLVGLSTRMPPTLACGGLATGVAGGGITVDTTLILLCSKCLHGWRGFAAVPSPSICVRGDAWCVASAFTFTMVFVGDLRRRSSSRTMLDTVSRPVSTRDIPVVCGGTRFQV